MKVKNQEKQNQKIVIFNFQMTLPYSPYIRKALYILHHFQYPFQLVYLQQSVILD